MHITVLQSTYISSIIGKHNQWLLRSPGLPPDLSSDREREGNANFGWGCGGGSHRFPPLALTVACRVDYGIANDC